MPINRPFPTVIDGEDFHLKPLLPPKAIIEEVLFQGFKMSLGGGSKTHKSWCLCDMALSIITPLSWFGLKCNKAKVLYLNLEIHPYFFQERMKSISEVRGIKTPLEKGMLRVWNLRGYACAFKDFLAEIKKEMERHPEVEVVILDPIYKIYGDLAENSAEDMTELLNALDELSVEFGVTIVFAAHFAKGNSAMKNHIDRISGSGVLAGRDPDVIMTLTPQSDSDDHFTAEVSVRHTAPVPKFVIKWEFPMMRLDKGADPNALTGKAGRPEAFDREELFELLPVTGLTLKQWKKAAKEQIGIPDRSFARYRTALVKNNVVVFEDGVYKPVTFPNP